MRGVGPTTRSAQLTTLAGSALRGTYTMPGREPGQYVEGKHYQLHYLSGPSTGFFHLLNEQTIPPMAHTKLFDKPLETTNCQTGMVVLLRG